MERLKVKLGNWTLDNPIMMASGTCGFGLEYSDFYDVNILGSMSLKGTTYNPRFGNMTPRIAEGKGGILNSVGLQNPGIHQVIEKELPHCAAVFKKPIVFNVSGFSIEEYVNCVKLLDPLDQVGIIEINISCPNVKDGGLSFGTSCENAAAVTKAVKAITSKPLYIKLSPNVTNIVEIAKACEQAGADGLVLINTLLGMRLDYKTGKPVLANIAGGYSGPPIFPVALRMVYDVYKAVSIPIIGVGGIASSHDVIEMMSAGATAVQIGSQNLVDPLICYTIINELPHCLNELNIAQISDLIGRAHR